jgi:acetoin:2,6-dichlorophenolindophenol oxidoreductase subunit beta
MRELKYVDAGVEALQEEMQRDSTLVYLGQGIGPRGGNFRQSAGLWQKFGEERVRDTGICELGTTGMGIGAAMAGGRAVVDNVFFDFNLEAMTQIIQQAATVSYLTNGEIDVPVVIRSAMGMLRCAGAHHSHTFYSWFASTPGLKVVLPSTPYDVKGLLKTALRDTSPVMFIEHKALYNTKGPVPEGEYTVPFGQARICREGKDVTVVATSNMVHIALRAATILAGEGIEVEVIDPRTIVPLDETAIIDSVKKTRRIVALDEAPAMCGFAGEILALVSEQCFKELDAPPSRICSAAVPNPFSPILEDAMVPSVDRVVSAVRGLILKEVTC